MSTINTDTITSSTTTLPVVKKERKTGPWPIFTQRVIGLLKTVHKEQQPGDGMNFASWLKRQREDYLSFTDQEILESVPLWLLEPRPVESKAPKEVKPRKERKQKEAKVAAEEKNTVITVSSSSSVVSVASSKKVKTEPKVQPKQQPKEVEDIQNILTAIRALKNISPGLALETAITSLQAFIDSH